MEEIQSLMDGDSVKFTLGTSLLFMIHNLLAYDTLISLITHGYHSCHACISNDFLRHSSCMCKCIYCGNHAYQQWTIHIVEKITFQLLGGES